MNDPSVETGPGTEELFPIFVMILLPALLTFVVRTGSIRLGVNVLRARLRTGMYVVRMERLH